MENQARYVRLSLEVHLFFARIMKEHAIFLEAGFTPKDASFAKAAEHHKNEFEQLLYHTARASNGLVCQKVLCSGELGTEFTGRAEQQTEFLTGIAINKDITQMIAELQYDENACITPQLVNHVRKLNRTAITLLNNLIQFKETILSNVLCCKMFTMNYPLLIEHILREAKLYRTYVLSLEEGNDLDCQSMKEIERFWNQIMMEHALFIRGLLDPTENELICAADGFAEDYAELLERSKKMNDKTISCSGSLEETLKFRDFKTAGVQGIQNCAIRSLILPLLADHVLREANHYLRLLED